MELYSCDQAEIRIHPTRVFVGGLARGTSELELENFFSDFGAITDVRIVCDKRTGLNKGYGFVTYENAESRDDVLKKGLIDFQGRKLRLRQAVRRKGCGQFVPSEAADLTHQSPTNGYQVQWVLVPESPPEYAATTYTPPHCPQPTVPVYYTLNKPWVPPNLYGYNNNYYMQQSGTTYYYM